MGSLHPCPFLTTAESLSSLFPHQVPDGNFPLHVVESGHWPSNFSVCGWSSLVSVGLVGQVGGAESGQVESSLGS